MNNEIGRDILSARRRFQNNDYGINPNQTTTIQFKGKRPIQRRRQSNNISGGIKSLNKYYKKRTSILNKLFNTQNLVIGLLVSLTLKHFKDLEHIEYAKKYFEYNGESEGGYPLYTEEGIGRIKNKIIREAERQGVDPSFALAVAEVESGFNPNAKSHVGATGVFQIMPNIAKSYGINALNEDQNIRVGIQMLKGHLKNYGGDKRKALAAYNWGSGNLAKYGIEKAPKETREHYRKIMEAESRIKSQANQRKAPSTKVSIGFGKFNGHKITSKYGWRKAPTAGASTFHEGIDLDYKLNEPVYSLTDGTCIFANKQQGGGNVVKIQEANGHIHAYLHLNVIKVYKGQQVKKGQLIGLAGSTGHSTGVHLDYRIKVNGKYVDPEEYWRNRNLLADNYNKVNKNVEKNKVQTQKAKPVSRPKQQKKVEKKVSAQVIPNIGSGGSNAQIRPVYDIRETFKAAKH